MGQRRNRHVANKTKKSDLPGATTLQNPLGAATLAREEWLFIDKRQYYCREDEKPYFVEYEYAREALAYQVQYPCVPAWQQVFGDHFPQTPFLAFDAVERQRLLAKAFKGDTGKLPLFDFTKELNLPYQFTYSLKQEYQDQLEAVQEEARENLKIAQVERLYEEAISGFKRNLPEDAYDESIAYVQLTIRFDHSNERLKKAFAAMLSEVRRTKPKSSKHDEPDDRLKRLAATKLYRIFGTVERARSYAFIHGIDNVYRDDSGWTRARDEVWKTLGVSAFPPAVTE